MIRSIRSASALSLAFAMASPAAAVQLVTNGGFETGTFSGWVRFGAAGQTNINAADALAGNFGARFSPNAVGGIEQSIATVAGSRYAISFDLRHVANLLTPNNAFSAEFNGVALNSFANVATLPTATYSFTQVATGSASLLKFSFLDTRDPPANRWSIDNISVELIPVVVGGVPEPAAWAMLVLGFGVVGNAARRRRTASVVA